MSSWRRLEDVLKTSFVFVFRKRFQDVFIKTNRFASVIRRSRRLSQDQYIRLDQDVLKTTFKTFSRRLAKTSSSHFQDFFKTSLRHLQDVLARRLEGVFKTSSRRLAKTYSRHLQEVSQRSHQTFVLMKTFWRRLEDVFRLLLQKTSSRRLQDVLIKTDIFALVIRLQKTSSRHLQDFVKTSSRVLAKTSSRHLQEVFKTFCKGIFKTFSRRIIKSSSLTVLANKSSRRIQHVSKMYCNDGYLQKDFPRSHFWEIYKVYKIWKSDKNFWSFSFSLYYTF